ncbi:Multidrug and toxin extrusion protein 1 [Echinococcus granulosus]|nr:Multidrug and toxin extrusion protein 1 [Echinococcus granulosus]
MYCNIFKGIKLHTFGGSNKFRLGVQVQRAIVILTFCCFPCWAVYIIIEPILLATNQPPLVAKYTGNYLLGLIPGLFFATTIEIFTKYVQVQNKVYPPLLASIIGNCVNAGAHYLFNLYSDSGFVGSAISQSLGFMAQASVVVAYILISRIYRNTWDAIHIELWHDWGIWFRLAVPGMMMLGLEWWVCESGSLLSGLRGEHALAVQTILNNFESLIFCTTKPKDDVRQGGGSADEQLIQMAADGLIVIPCFLFTDSLVAVCSGIIRGVGMQRTGAIVSMVCMYIIGGPMGLCLLMLTNLGVSGFWLGLCLGTGLESVVYIVIIKRIDWNEMCRKATKRTEIKFINLPPEQPDIVIKEEERSLHESDANLEACTPATEKANDSSFFLITFHLIFPCHIRSNSSANLFTCLSFFITILFNPLASFIEDACSSALFANLVLRPKAMDLSSGYLRAFLWHGLVYPTDPVVGHGDVGGRFSCEPLVMHDSTPKSTSIIYDSSAVIQANSVSTSGMTTWTSSASTSTTNSP